MKKYLYLLPAILCFVSIGCDDLLDVEAENTISGDVIIDSESAQNVLNGAYFNLYGIYDGGNGGELLGGDFKLIPTLLSRHDGQEISWQSEVFPEYTRFAQKSFTEINPRIEANWLRGYETINIVNNILANIDVVTTDRAEIEGQALAIRGLLYFEMVRLWAPQYSTQTVDEAAIPVFTTPFNESGDLVEVTKETVGGVYTQVENDLSQASTLLEGTSIPQNRISYYAVEAYRGKVAMQKQEYSDAVAHFDNVIAGPFQLMNTPLDAFNNPAPVTEDVLAITQTINANTGNINSATGLTPIFSTISNTGFGAFQILESTFGALQKTFIPNNAKFYEADIRHSINADATASSAPESIDSAFYKVTGNLSSSKFTRSTDVVPVIRLAEIHLARAEAIHETSFASPIDATALSDINAIRTRARLPALENTLDEFAFLDSIRVEKNRELLYEGLVFHDLKRWRLTDNSVTIAFGLNPLDQDLILQIPLTECNASPGLCD